MRKIPVLILSIVALTLALTSCGQRGSPTATDPVARARLQNAAEADAGAQAAKLMLGAAMMPGLSDILDGSAAFARATMGEDQRPAPAWTPSRIVLNPVEYRKAGESAERSANGTQWLFWLKVIGGSVGTVALGLLSAVLAKELPGIGPVIGKLAEGIWQAWTPKATKQEDEARTVLASHASSVLEIAANTMPAADFHRLIGQVPPEVTEAAELVGIAMPIRSALPSLSEAAAIAGTLASVVPTAPSAAV